MKIIGITGGIGSGKSTIVRELASRGYAIYDCDSHAKRLIVSRASIRQQIIALLGEEAFLPGEEADTYRYNTSYVSQLVFSNPQLLQQLNSIIHPALAEDIQVASQEHELLFVEAAILYEAGWDSLCDTIFLIDAPEEVRLSRTLARDYQSEVTDNNISKVRARMRAQNASHIIETKAKKKPIVLMNDGSQSIEELANQIIRCL